MYDTAFRCLLNAKLKSKKILFWFPQIFGTERAHLFKTALAKLKARNLLKYIRVKWPIERMNGWRWEKGAKENEDYTVCFHIFNFPGENVCRDKNADFPRYVPVSFCKFVERKADPLLTSTRTISGRSLPSSSKVGRASISTLQHLLITSTRPTMR